MAASAATRCCRCARLSDSAASQSDSSSPQLWPGGLQSRGRGGGGGCKCQQLHYRNDAGLALAARSRKIKGMGRASRRCGGGGGRMIIAMMSVFQHPQQQYLVPLEHDATEKQLLAAFASVG